MACAIYPVVFVSNDGVFFKVLVSDLSVSPFRELVKIVRKMHTQPSCNYLFVRTSANMLSYVFSQAFVRYEVMNIPWGTVLSIVHNVVEVTPSAGYTPIMDDLVKQWQQADQTTDPIDDFLAKLSNEDISMNVEEPLTDLQDGDTDLDWDAILNTPEIHGV